MTTQLSISDQHFLMETAMLECSIKENVSIDELRIVHGKSGAWYIVSREVNPATKQPVKVWFKKIF